MALFLADLSRRQVNVDELDWAWALFVESGCLALEKPVLDDQSALQKDIVSSL